MKHISVKIWGDVQGVSFRQAAKSIADKLHISGFVKNAKDGTVYIEAEGDENSLLEFAEWCKRGPDDSRVRRIELRSGEARGLKDFRVII